MSSRPKERWVLQVTVYLLAQKTEDCVGCRYVLYITNSMTWDVHLNHWTFCVTCFGSFFFFPPNPGNDIPSVKQMLWPQSQELKVIKRQLKLPVSTSMYRFIVLLPLAIWSHSIFSSVRLQCLSSLWIHAWVWNMHLYGCISKTEIQSTVLLGQSSECLILRQKERFPLT